MNNESEPHVVGNYKDQARQRSQDAAHALLKAVNEIGFDNRAFAKAICDDHRTLQQGVMRAFAVCLRKWARQREQKYFDLRNDATTAVSEKIIKQFGDDMFFPLI